ncbi:CsbD family protein [Alkaliphilus pronyensis]|uniref:CsbD family protein n=1 Tax=Alkaliphilus pronyensis TaxID=1482732 RepID=A0A6I0F5D3_9FIRM|nr:CsbD family protein [Alkaliphilus pronyensis]KAB3531296.1 CsbD family protein [Alkaliphilus pronyensis]
MRKEELKGKWNQVKGGIKEKWGQLSDDTLLEIDGNYEQLVGTLQELYGITKEEAEKQVNEVLDLN